MNCKICNNHSDFFLESTLFNNKQKVTYYKCKTCYFIQSEEPYWLDRAYASAITKSDIGLISRNIYNSNLLENILLHLFPNVNKCLDYAAGYGMFVRIMRDRGFDFYWHDDYCENIFSEHFVGSLSAKYDIITAFEVFEHLPNPTEIIEKLLSISETIFFTTELTDNVSDFNSWWYRGEISGQHISFFHTNTLQYIANKNKLYYYSFANQTLHLLAKNKIDEQALNVFLHPPQRTIWDRILRRATAPIVKPRTSFLTSDYNTIIKQLNS